MVKQIDATAYIAASCALYKQKVYLGNYQDEFLSADITADKIDEGAVTGAKILDDTITDADVSVSAAIAGTKPIITSSIMLRVLCR